MNDLKQRLTDWYNRNVQAGWYASAALIGGWLTAGLAWLPEGLQFIVDHFDFFGPMILPKLEPETKAILLSVYVTFIAPPLRAKLQNWMTEKSIKQQAESGKVIPLAASGVALPLSPVPDETGAPGFILGHPTAAEAEVARLVALEAERMRLNPGPK